MGSWVSSPLRAQDAATRCDTCHADQAEQFQSSVHSASLGCQDCHGGRHSYDLTPEQRGRLPAGRASLEQLRQWGPFDHGQSFRGKPSRGEIPEACGTCHADVARMNAFGLRTDQLAAYWVSGHGKRLKEAGDLNVAVCVDCHGIHDVLRHDNPQSRTYFRNIPNTCARCHADPSLMDQYGHSSKIIEQYSQSIHGRNVLEAGDSGSPQCATCHGSHGAAPPGVAEVGHVCGQCHQQIEEYFLNGTHGQIPGLVRCVVCHGGQGNPKDHHITEASPPVEVLVDVYTQLRSQTGGAADPTLEAFTEQADILDGSLKPETVCRYCHQQEKSRSGHEVFFKDNDHRAMSRGQEITKLFRRAQFEYARTAERIERVGRGVLLVREEALRAEDAKTSLMGMASLMHTIDLPEIEKRGAEVEDVCSEVNAALDAKEAGLAQRRVLLGLGWVFIVVFFVLMYGKYLSLRRAYVVHPGHSAPDAAQSTSTGRRRLLDTILSVMGATTVLALLWPAVAYILPARKRGGGSSRTSAGQAGDWEEWVVRKVSVGGKPVAVLRTAKGFRAYSAICTHLGCIVHWDFSKREFLCPCHAAVFSDTGEVVSGPPPKALPEYAVKVVQDEVIVTEMT
ncbi:MAG: Rieske 2Fe-2S domain-containing protein [Phycisphaerae bacterium]